MENAKPKFGLSDYSPIQVASALHAYSRDMQSYYKIERGHLLSKLDAISDEAELTQIKAALQLIDQKMEYFHILNNAASTVDAVLHSPSVVADLKHL